VLCEIVESFGTFISRFRQSHFVAICRWAGVGVQRKGCFGTSYWHTYSSHVDSLTRTDIVLVATENCGLAIGIW